MKKPALIFMGLLAAASLFASACGGGEPPAAPRATLGSAEVSPIPGTPNPLAISIIKSATGGDARTFDTDKLTAKAGSQVVMTFNNASPNELHNWVLVQAGTSDAVAVAGTTAGLENSYIPSGDERIIAHTDLLDPETTGEVQFIAPAAGTYEFVCTVPGHQFTMLGDFIVTQ